MGFINFVVILLIGTGVAFAMNSAVQKVPVKKYFEQTHTNAVWDWSNLSNRSERELQDIADFLYMHQINTVFLDISKVNDLQAVSDEKERAKMINQFERDIKRYIEFMRKKNIKVFAAAGNSDWSKRDLQKVPLNIQSFVFQYNQKYEEKINGIEFDIEAYNQSNFEKASFTEKEMILTEYLDLVDKIASNQQNYINTTLDKDMELGFAIPYWFDNENGNIKSVEWQNKTGPVLFHLIDRLNSLPKSNLVVMSYRNAAQGSDGSIFHARTEIDYAQSKSQNVKVLIGIEVNDVEPKKITYFGRTYRELSGEVFKIYKEFENTKAYGGVAINDLKGFQLMGN